MERRHQELRFAGLHVNNKWGERFTKEKKVALSFHWHILKMKSGLIS